MVADTDRIVVATVVAGTLEEVEGEAAILAPVVDQKILDLAEVNMVRKGIAEMEGLTLKRLRQQEVVGVGVLGKGALRVEEVVPVNRAEIEVSMGPAGTEGVVHMAGVVVMEVVAAVTVVEAVAATAEEVDTGRIAHVHAFLL